MATKTVLDSMILLLNNYLPTSINYHDTVEHNNTFKPHSNTILTINWSPATKSA